MNRGACCRCCWKGSTGDVPNAPGSRTRWCNRRDAFAQIFVQPVGSQGHGPCHTRHMLAATLPDLKTLDREALQALELRA